MTTRFLPVAGCHCFRREPPHFKGSGSQFEDCNEADPNQPGSRFGVAAYALDPDAAARLWQVSLDTLAR
jgi:hypothetical protein